MNEAEKLARQTLEVLDLQAEYFKSRATEKLRECKTAEAKLRTACADILHPKQSQPTLFDRINAGLENPN